MLRVSISENKEVENNYIFQLNINTLDIKILYNLRGFTVQVT